MQIKRSRRKTLTRARRGGAPTRRVAVVESLEQAQAALDGAKGAIVLASPPGTADYLGVGYFWALVEAARAADPAVAIDAVMDCGDDPGRALAALRTGFKIVALRGDPRVRAKVAAIARDMGARLLRHPPRTG